MRAAFQNGFPPNTLLWRNEMSFWNNVKLSLKRPLIMLTLSSVTLVGMGILGFYNAKDTLYETAKTQLYRFRYFETHAASA